MKSYATFHRRPYGRVVPPTNEDRPTWDVVPYGKLGAGLWTGHPVGLVICVGIIVIGLVGIPEWRWFFGASVLVGSFVAFSLWRLHNHEFVIGPTALPALGGAIKDHSSPARGSASSMSPR